MIFQIPPLPSVAVREVMIAGALSPIGTLPDAAILEQMTTVYEVIRIHCGQPVFWQEHLERLISSSEAAGITLPPVKKWAHVALALADRQRGTQNLMIRVLRAEEGGELTVVAHFIESRYPSDEMYREGVPLGLLSQERANPSAKVMQVDLRQEARRAIQVKGVHEVLLVNRAGCITEGSRSNVIFARGDTIFTSPLRDVLGGITRAKIVEVAGELGVQFVEQEVGVEELENFDGLAITGTSPGVLPVSRVGQHVFNPRCPVILRLREGYERKVSACLAGQS